ncbi:hypothetical protein CDL15_Pgr011014 [Punica granatum]|uniref:Uncharacterized protein n=1 Tax=Punica granatum TaxID=22663 RepID=A0A218XN14_PUNGR|nr:hypothetical protein CDL15_Pgr011014 [Punica granatum]
MKWYCAHPNFVSSRYAYARLNATRLGSVHLPGDARRMHVRRSRHYLFTTQRSRAVSCPGLGVWDTSSMLRQWFVRNRKFRIRGFYYVWAYIPYALSVL